MITRAHIDFYRTFGYVVLPGLIGDDVAAALSEEFDRVLPEAFGARWPEREEDGISGHYLPAFGPRTPVGKRLADELLPVGEALLGAPALPWDVQEILLFDQAEVLAEEARWAEEPVPYDRLLYPSLPEWARAEA